MPNTLHCRYLLASVLFLLFSFVSVHASERDCDQLAQDNAAWQQQMQALGASNAALSEMLSGRLPEQTVIISRILAPIGVERSAVAARALLRQQKQQIEASLTRDYTATLSALPCDELAQTWLEQHHRLLQSQLSNHDLQAELLDLDAGVLRVLFRAIRAWQSVEAVVNEVEKASKESASLDAVTATSQTQALLSWQSKFRSALQGWLPLILAPQMELEAANKQWQQTMALPRVTLVMQWTQLQEGFGEQALSWQEALINARAELVMAHSHWRNDVIWSQGWTAFVGELVAPAEFIELLLTEALAAPANVWDQVSAPFIREYRYYQRQNALASLFSTWAMHVVAVFLTLFLTIKLAESIPAWIARAQQASLQNLESDTGTQLVSGVFWLIKPNAPWLIVLVITQVVAGLAKPMSILAWLGPIGALYALFRVTRIVFEWLLSRTYSRAGEFVPQATAKQIIVDCHQFAWAILLCGFIWWLGIGTGGGYLRFFIALATVFIAWWALQWLLLRHDQAVQRFLVSASWFRREQKSGEKPSLLVALMRKVVTPVRFLLLHSVDGLRSLNQKLLNFDGYRAFSVKLLRAHLESKAEDAEEDEAEPDENYSDWMRRAASDDMVLEVGDPARLLTPLQHWFKDKTDENVVMLVGDAGSGKTTFLKKLHTIWDATEVDYLRFESKTMQPKTVLDKLAETLHLKEINDVGELVKLDANLEPRVVVIDDAHNLFLAEVGCFDAYKTLMQCMNAQLENIFWVVSMHAPSWSYLSCVFSREQRISNIYRMSRWSPQEIRRLVLSRHQGSKRRLRYNELLLSASASSESSSVRSADSRVFNILWEQSAGNPAVAIELWLSAAKVKGRVIEMGVPQRPESAMLKSLKNDLYFVLSAIVVHRRLSTQEIMKATHFSEALVRHALKQGINMGVIVRESDGRYAIDAYWWPTLNAFLQGKNLLWSV